MNRFSRLSWVVVSTAALALQLVQAAGASAQSRQFSLANDGGSRAHFVSDAPLETITGVASHVTGQIEIDPQEPNRIRGEVRVRVDSLRTGIDLRDEHLRSDSWLDAQRFPEIVFRPTALLNISRLEPNQSASGTVRGELTLHGVSRTAYARVQLRLVPHSEELSQAHIAGDVLRVQANFQIRLSDFNVSISSPVRLKVSNELEINVTLRGVGPAASRT